MRKKSLQTTDDLLWFLEDSTTESLHQEAVVEYLRWHKIPHFSIPNGGFRRKSEAKKLRLQGVSAGIPDLMVPVPTDKFHGLFIEMKKSTATKSAISHEQNQWLTLLNKLEYHAIVAFGADEAISEINTYLGKE